MKYGARFMNLRQPTLEELVRVRDVRYFCRMDGAQFELADQGADVAGPFAACTKCSAKLRPRPPFDQIGRRPISRA